MSSRLGSGDPLTNGMIGLSETFRNVVRDNYLHETPGPSPGGGGYLSNIHRGFRITFSRTIMFWYGNKVDVMRAAGGGQCFRL